ncbi:formimidoylglutamate deiminase [Granulicella aggregans]|uniref:Formimidoylglutamate deiminase n=1 Tax=Granulicella aggregans TaxID=474949 RepID=A0A7W8E470_9BACT|nr:formimidoylglutamate deiminase [Granulicella aggregans]MBB5056855.1 formimidoylglutamate deiminase [Granulicella aggregans]
MPTLYLPELLYMEGAFHAGMGLLVGGDGVILNIGADLEANGAKNVRMPGKAMLPGLVNGHSHTFQRLIRGVAEHCGANGDDFWAWRNTMYRAASQLTPEELYDVARMAFLEMALTGITAVGEFHYLHRQPDGTAYDDPNLLSMAVIEAARSVGLRICLLRVAYSRAGYQLPPNPGQARFYETNVEYLNSMERLAADLQGLDPTVTFGVAPHSIRAVTLDEVRKISEWAEMRGLPIHMHMAEQAAELAACVREYGYTPIKLMVENNLLSSNTTLVHAIHVTVEEIAHLACAGATICSCPTTERNLGDGIIDADQACGAGVPFSFGTDSQANINLLEDARELDYHLRLKRERRVLLDGINGEEISQRLFGYATTGGAKSLRMNTGELKISNPADFFTLDLNDVSIAGAAPKELLSTIVFGSERTAVSDVVSNGRVLVSNRQSALTEEIVTRYTAVARRLSSLPA